jgi:hypothetical protein
MNKTKFYWLFCVCILFACSACVEIIDDLTLNADGSGKWNLKINFSESTVKINSILSLDSINGLRVPSIDDLRKRSARFNDVVNAQPGIKSASYTEDLTHFIWTFSFEFNSIEQLEKALLTALEDQKVKGLHLPENGFVRQNGNAVSKQMPFDLSELSKKINAEDRSKLFQGKYISILRFNSTILKNTNLRYKIAQNLKATMAQFSLGECLNNSQIINNTSTLNK